MMAAWRARAGITQEVAGARLGIKQGQYSKYENGSRKPRRKLANDIAMITDGAVPSAAWDIPESVD